MHGILESIRRASLGYLLDERLDSIKAGEQACIAQQIVYINHTKSGWHPTDSCDDVIRVASKKLVGPSILRLNMTSVHGMHELQAGLPEHSNGLQSRHVQPHALQKHDVHLLPPMRRSQTPEMPPLS